MRKYGFAGVLLAGVLLVLAACAPPAGTANSNPAVSINNQTAAPAQIPAVAAPATVPAAGNPSPTITAPAPVPEAAPAAPAPAPAQAAANFRLTNLKITPDTAKATDVITITATDTNTGGQAGSDNVTLSLVMEGVGCPSFNPITNEVTLAPGASQDTSFKLTLGPGSEGIYDVTVGHLTGTLTIE